MFAYCLCNPVNYYDSKGTDAIWIQEGNSAESMGHSGLLVQDGDGNWWYFYWGPANPNANFMGMCFYTDEICVFVDLNVNGADIQNITDVRAALQNCPNSSDARVGEQADDITGILYLKGDYTNTYRYLSTLSNPETLDNPMVQYSLLLNNCSQQTVRALSASNGAFLSVDSLIPNYAYIQAKVINNKQNNSSKFEFRVALL